jgi:hypothetical protein
MDEDFPVVYVVESSSSVFQSHAPSTMMKEDTCCLALLLFLLSLVELLFLLLAHPIEGTLAGLNSRLNLDRHAR